MHINLSFVQIAKSNVIKDVIENINKYDAGNEHFVFEITESIQMDSNIAIKRVLKEFVDNGFLLAIDDFGTGYSNLVRVLEYPVDVIKLDKSIVWSAFQNRDSFVTLKNLISMFHDVHRKIVAEGIESEEQMNMLKKLECDYLQGYFYSKPIDKDAFISYVQHNQKYN